MSSNLGTILSMIFVIAFILLGGDMMCLSAAYSALDSTAITISYLISKEASVDEDFLTYLEEEYSITISNIRPQNPTYGDVVDFTIYRNYHPIVISSNDVVLKASRSTVLGYFG